MELLGPKPGLRPQEKQTMKADECPWTVHTQWASVEGSFHIAVLFEESWPAENSKPVQAALDV